MDCRNFTPIPDELLVHATQAEREAYEKALFRCVAMASPLDFMLAVDQQTKDYRHSRFISDKVAAAVPGDKILFTMPPREGKSWLISKGVPAWAIARDPRTQVLHATYAHDFTVTFGRAIRRMIQTGQKLGIAPRLDPTAKAVDNFFVHPDDGSGFYFGDGVGGGFTGRGGHIILLDDLIKNKEEADSQFMRDKTWDWMESVALTREESLEDEDGGYGIILGVGTPWHEDDWIGRARLTGEWKVYNLAALAEEGDPLGRPEGEALNPVRRSRTFYLGVKARNPLTFAAMYQGHPSPEDGDVFQKSTLRYYKELPPPDTWGAKFATVDLAHSKKRRADFSVLSVWLVTKPPRPRLYWIAMFRDKIASGDHMDWVYGQLGSIEPELRPRWIVVGDKTFGSSLMDAARKHPVPGMPPFKPVDENEDKWSKAQPAAALQKQGGLWVPEDAPWIGDAITEMMMFPNGKHDDIVDTLAYAGGEFNMQPWVRRQKEDNEADQSPEAKARRYMESKRKKKSPRRLRKRIMS